MHAFIPVSLSSLLFFLEWQRLMPRFTRATSTSVSWVILFFSRFFHSCIFMSRIFSVPDKILYSRRLSSKERSRFTARQHSYAERCTSYSKSVRMSVTRWHCVNDSRYDHGVFTVAIGWPHDSSLFKVNFTEKIQSEDRERWRRIREGYEKYAIFTFSANKSPYLTNGAR